MSRHPTYKLTPATAKAMRIQHAGGRTRRELAEAFGVSRPTVSAVLRYARYEPALSETQQRQLAELASRLGVTRDEALEQAFERGVKAVGD